ncbi:MAG: Endonuclease III [Candidatus Ozemobacter sibiricus]|uniref:Endonuclease III n=1 Tax=Candidatus Ozemobacter sibiricus TaxID=2268124 RepID=A0A367ZRT3_9BACT|nr:MAG: Endonuclease III [Candidatus Ozemobacter sibiricus]
MAMTRQRSARPSPARRSPRSMSPAPEAAKASPVRAPARPDSSAPDEACPGRAVLPEMLAILKRTYPGATCALHFDNPLQLLVATILSAQCTDQRVNQVTRALFKKYKTAADYAAADPAVFAQEIRSTGFFQNKTKSILACCRQLVERHGGQVPADLDALVALPGVGRKTANVVLGTAFGIAAGIVVDTHVTRLAKRLGLSRETAPEKIEADLMALVPRDDWIIFSHLLILHGRARCTARSPDCAGCELGALCPRLLG